MATSGTNGPQCFGGLPAELRLMVWEYLLPGRRILKAMARHGRPRFLSDECIASNDWEPRWNFQITSVVENPLLLRLCGESRAFALKKGHYVFFNIEYKEPGMWWGPEDVLLFNEEWLNKVHLNSLKDLSGLEHVQHIALDLEQSRYTAFVLGVPETLITASETGWLLADFVCLAFPKVRASFLEDERHFIPRFFANVREITLLFDKLWQYSPSWSGRGLPVRRDFCNARDTRHGVVTFRAGSPMRVAIHKIIELSVLWVRARIVSSILGELSDLEACFDYDHFTPQWPFAAMDNIDLARVGELRLLKFLDGQQQWTVMEAWHFNP